MERETKKNLDDLNEDLFKLFSDLKEDRVKPEKAKAMNQVASTIIKSARTQLQALKLFRTTEAPSILGLSAGTIMSNKDKDKHSKMNDYAHELGYDNVSVAMASLGRDTFTERFNEQNKEEE